MLANPTLAPFLHVTTHAKIRTRPYRLHPACSSNATCLTGSAKPMSVDKQQDQESKLVPTAPRASKRELPPRRHAVPQGRAKEHVAPELCTRRRVTKLARTIFQSHCGNRAQSHRRSATSANTGLSRTAEAARLCLVRTAVCLRRLQLHESQSRRELNTAKRFW